MEKLLNKNHFTKLQFKFLDFDLQFFLLRFISFSNKKNPKIKVGKRM